MLVAIGFIDCIQFFLKNGYLPSPFLFDKSDTFMDLFNPMYWAFDAGRYTEWGSVYPPLNFILLRVLNFVSAGEWSGSPEFMRDNSPLVIMVFCLVYLVIPVVMLTMRHWQGISTRDKILIYFVIILSPPMLFALERGNLVVLCPVFLAIVLSKIDFLRGIGIALLINFKPYFVIFLLYYAIRKDWKGLIYCTFLSGIFFMIPGLILDENYIFFLKNILDFSQEQNLFSLREIMSFPASISVFSYVLKNPEGAMFASRLIGLDKIPFVIILIEFFKWSVIIMSLVFLIKKSDVMRDEEIFTLLTLVITNLGIWVGGYTLIYYTALIPVFIKMRGHMIYMAFLSLMVMPLDMIPLIGESIGNQYSFLFSSTVYVDWTLGVGSMVRPIINIALPMILCYEFLTRRCGLMNNCRISNPVLSTDSCAVVNAFPGNT